MGETPERGSAIPIVGVIIFYGLMAGGAGLWDHLRDGPTFILFTSSPDIYDLLLDVVIGAGVGGAFVVLDRILERWCTWARRLGKELSSRIGRLTLTEVVVFSVMSAIGEELLFRGAMQPSLGIIITSLIFGFLHGMFDKKLWMWLVISVAMGFVLGGLVLWRGNLTAAVIAHFTINFFNLQDLGKETGARESTE